MKAAPRLPVMQMRSCSRAPLRKTIRSFGGVSQGRDGDRKAGHRGARVTAREVHAQLVAGEADAFVEVVERLDGQFRGDAERQDDLRRAGVHGQNVAHSGRHDLVAQVFEREVGEVEIHAFEEGVGRTSSSSPAGAR